jgi:hypothetical protein
MGMGKSPALDPSAKVCFAAGWHGRAPMNRSFALSGSGSIPPDATHRPTSGDNAVHTPAGHP